MTHEPVSEQRHPVPAADCNRAAEGKPVLTDCTPYRPSNASEGEAFCSLWCAKCQREPDFEDPAEWNACQIATATLFYGIDAPEYPKEWCYRNGSPVCTAFVGEGDELTELNRDDKTPDLFEVSA